MRPTTRSSPRRATGIAASALLTVAALLVAGCQTSPPSEAETPPTGERGGPSDEASTDPASASPTGESASEPGAEPAPRDESMAIGDGAGSDRNGDAEGEGELALDGGFIAVDGLEVRGVSCTIAGEDGGMAMLDLMIALADVKPKIDACAPEGDAVEVELRWLADTFEIEVVRSALGRVDGACLGAAIAASEWAHESTCRAVMLVGDAAVAAEAADAWVPRPEE